MEPVLKIARRIIEKYRLTYPFSISDFAEHIVNIEYGNLPSDVDGIVLQEEIPKPTVILNTASSASRKIFTLAHEIGHYFIPWHPLNFVCQADEGWISQSSRYWLTEGEANKFAAELLMPQNWIKSLAAENASIPLLIQNVCKMGVSSTAACFSICRALGPGHVFVETDTDNKVLYSSKSKNTIASPPTKGSIFHEKLFAYSGCSITSTKNGFNKLYWLDFTDSEHRGNIGIDIKTEIDSRILLKDFLDIYTISQEVRTSLSRRINGVIGAANTKCQNRNFECFYNVLCQRFASNHDLSMLLTDDLFRRFLEKKAYELTDR
ncbi:MAG: ImmA/IrrE family metallo-endopeptidase [Desulfovibrionaceae bacterium]|nr:ImmA/IrrE family metallo-endopeptidase [Desulfovibrionaceae bacterium]